jgi:hypothetical protein
MRILSQAKEVCQGNRLLFTSLLISGSNYRTAATRPASTHSHKTIRGGSTTMSGKDSDPSFNTEADNENPAAEISMSSSSPTASRNKSKH